MVYLRNFKGFNMAEMQGIPGDMGKDRARGMDKAIS